MGELDGAMLADRHRRQQRAVREDLTPETWEPPFAAGGGGGGTTRVWVKVVTVYDEQAGGPGKHSEYGRCLGLHELTLSFPMSEGDGDISWSEGTEEVVGFPDPVVLDALDQARADPDGLGTAIHLDDYYESDQMYKADRVRGRLIVVREPFAILGGPEYEEPA